MSQLTLGSTGASIPECGDSPLINLLDKGPKRTRTHTQQTMVTTGEHAALHAHTWTNTLILEIHKEG